MEAGHKHFMKFISDEVQFKIPKYQRLYDWKNEHCKTLLDDMKNLLKMEKIPIHFVGSIVYIDEEGQTRVGSTQKVLVIDGQQRLTTFTLIFLVLMRMAEENGNIGLANKIKYTGIINQYSDQKNKHKLILTQNDNEVLEKLIRNDDMSNINSNIIKNFKFIQNELYKLNEEFTVKEIYNIFNRIMIVDVCLNYDHDNPQQIFESLNATGKALTEGDLIRNFILMNLTLGEQNKIYDSYWYPIESLLGERLTGFLETYIYMKKGKSTNIKDLYKEFKLYFFKKYGHNRVEEIASDLLKYAKYFYIINNKNDGCNLVNKALQNLDELGIYRYYPPLLRCFDEKAKGKVSNSDLVEIINGIESFLFRRGICDVPTNSLNPIFRTLWNKVDKSNIKNSIIELLFSGEDNQRWPDDNEFKEKLIYDDRYNKRFCKLLLIELEKFNNKEANKDFSKLTIEHILPQTSGDSEKLSENWKKMLGVDYSNVRDQWLHKLGNLTLTGYNPEYSDKDFNEKKKMENGYIDSGLRLNTQVANYDEWNESSIKDRAEKLSLKAIQRWKIPSNLFSGIGEGNTLFSKDNFNTVEVYKWNLKT